MFESRFIIQKDSVGVSVRKKIILHSFYRKDRKINSILRTVVAVLIHSEKNIKANVQRYL